MRHTGFSAPSTAAIALLLAGTALPALAQQSADAAGDSEVLAYTDVTASDSWRYELKLYIWGTDVGGEAAGSDFELGFDDVLDNLDFALMGALYAYSGDWMLFGEASYADLGKTTGGTYDLPAGSIDIDADFETQTTIVNLGAGYRLIDKPDYQLYGTFGARYLQLESKINFNVPAIGQSVSAENDQDYWDAVIGLAGRAQLGGDWFVPYLVDIGTGQSDLTWQAYAGVGYSFGRSDVVLGYRHMEWDLPDDDLVTEYYQTGPILLWNIRF